MPSDIPVDKAQQTTAELAQRVGVTPDRAGFSVPETDLILAQGGGFQPLEEPTADDLIALLRAVAGQRQLGPVVDGTLHPWTVEDGLRAGAGNDVPL